MIGVEEAARFLPALPPYVAVNIPQLKTSILLSQLAAERGVTIQELQTTSHHPTPPSPASNP